MLFPLQAGAQDTHSAFRSYGAESSFDEGQVDVSNVIGDDTSPRAEEKQTQQETTPKAPNSDKSAKSDTQKKADNAAPKSEPSATFVDKNGDGINDGKEYRFRKREKAGDRKDRKRLLRKNRQPRGGRGQ
ncbi:MAG: hypothetical protein JXX29_01780 [Deltaproteobacteria bacterium]|nr:hypothetical protein [Deltaproteobacteria bacterium]